MKIITIHGRLGKDCEDTDKGNLKFTVAVTDDVDTTKTDWFTCYSDKKTLREYLKKGKEVLITGRLYFTNSKSNNDVQFFNISVDSIKLLGGNRITTKENKDTSSEETKYTGIGAPTRKPLQF